MASSPSTRQYEREAKHSEDRIYVLRLYIAGFAPASMRTLAHLRALCDSHFKGRGQLEVIDILQRPDLARADRIIAVPALVQESPPPKRTRIEDLLRQKTGIASFEKHPVIDTLRRHLEEDEGGLHAIRSGEIDALVVSGPKGDQIYLVEAVEQANRRCLEAGNEGNLMLLADGTIAYGNQRFADLLRIPLQQIIGAALATLAAPSSRGPLQALLQQALTAKTEGEISFVTGEGALLWLKLSLCPADPARPVGMCLAATDITARKRAEETRSHLAAIVESSADAIIGMDLDGKIRSWNSGAQNLYGYSAAQAMGRSVSLLVPPERLGELASNLLRIKAGEAVDSFQTERLRKGGERVPVAIAISPIRDANGYITGASSIARDITGSKRAGGTAARGRL